MCVSCAVNKKCAPTCRACLMCKNSETRTYERERQTFSEERDSERTTLLRQTDRHAHTRTHDRQTDSHKSPAPTVESKTKPDVVVRFLLPGGQPIVPLSPQWRAATTGILNKMSSQQHVVIAVNFTDGANGQADCRVYT